MVVLVVVDIVVVVDVGIRQCPYRSLRPCPSWVIQFSVYVVGCTDTDVKSKHIHSHHNKTLSIDSNDGEDINYMDLVCDSIIVILINCHSHCHHPQLLTLTYNNFTGVYSTRSVSCTITIMNQTDLRDGSTKFYRFMCTTHSHNNFYFTLYYCTIPKFFYSIHSLNPFHLSNNNVL